MVGLSQMNRSSLRERERKREREGGRGGERRISTFLECLSIQSSMEICRKNRLCLDDGLYLSISIYLSVERHGSTVHLVKPSLQLAFCQEPFIILWQPLGTISNAHTGPRISVRKEAAATAGTPPSLSGSGA